MHYPAEIIAGVAVDARTIHMVIHSAKPGTTQVEQRSHGQAMLHDDPPTEPDALPRVITRAEALARGLPGPTIASRVSRGAWRRLLPYTYLTASTLTDRDRMAAALAYAGAGAALSGSAALIATGVRGVEMPARVLVLVPPGNYAKSVTWVRVRRTDRPFVVEPWARPRYVTTARATADLAVEKRRLGDVRTLVARVVQDRHCTIAELGAELESGPRRGSKFLRQALEEVGWGAASAPEAEAARILRRAGITGFVQNAIVQLPDGSTRVLDFYWPTLRACLEIDSVEFHFDRADWSGTWDRHLDLSTFGYSVIHRPPSALRDEKKFARDVRAWLAGREADLRRGLGS